MANLYSNENFPRQVAEELRLLGHDLLSSFEAGRANQQVPDEQVLAFATEQRRAVLTLNRFDFIRLHRETQAAHAGIIVCTRDDADAAPGRCDTCLARHGRSFRIQWVNHE